MCELAAAPVGLRARVSRAEADLAAHPGFVASHTLDLVDHVVASGHAPRLVVGGDILRDASKWYRWDDVVARAPLIVVGRAGHPDAGRERGDRGHHAGDSATRIRDLLAAGWVERRRASPA